MPGTITPQTRCNLPASTLGPGTSGPKCRRPCKGGDSAMTLSTAFTRLFGIQHPIALAPMGGSAGGALAAAVSNGGGLGVVGAGRGDRDWLARELPIAAE